jgi:hypothetical protein
MDHKQRLRYLMMQLYSAVEARSYTMADIYLRALQDALAKDDQGGITGKLQVALNNVLAGKSDPNLEDALRALDAQLTRLTDPSPVRAALAAAHK